MSSVCSSTHRIYDDAVIEPEAIPTSPLPGYLRRNVLTDFYRRTLVRSGPDRLELRFGLAGKAGGVFNLALGIVLVAVFGPRAVSALGSGPARGLVAGVYGVLCAGGLAFVLSSLYILTDRRAVRFDRDARRMTIVGVLASEELPLAEIEAVQLVSGGIQRRDESGDYETYQVNVVAADRSRRRVNVLEFHREELTRTVAAELAAFLGVPFLDRPDLPSVERVDASSSRL